MQIWNGNEKNCEGYLFVFVGTMNTILAAVGDTGGSDDKKEVVNQLKELYTSVVSFYVVLVLSA